MPRERSYRFMVTPRGQNPTTREFQRSVRSHAASVSHRDHITRRQPRRRSRNVGEGVIEFNVTPIESGEDSERQNSEFLLVAAQTDEFTITPRRSEPDYNHQPADPRTSLSLACLLPDRLSGNTFSPLQHLTTYHRPYLPGIVNHYIYNLTIPIIEVDGNTAVPLFRTTWLPVVFHDPVVFQVVVLFAATHYATFADSSQYNQSYLELLTLKQSALAALIQTVQGEQTMPSISTTQGCDSRDTLIAAAAKMASYEAIFGTREAFHLHMSTVTRLLRLQGGLATLGMNGFLARLLSFIDTNSAVLLGTNLYLLEFGFLNPMQQNQPFLPRSTDEAAPQAPYQIMNTNVVNLERFIGLMNVSGEDDNSVTN